MLTVRPSHRPAGLRAGPGHRHVRPLGEFVAGRRDEFVIAAKYGAGIDGTEGFGLRGNSRKAMVRAVEGSLRRLNTDYVDLAVHDAVHAVAEELDVASAVAGYAWLLAMARPSTTAIVPVIGAGTPEQLTSDLAALTLHLPSGQLARLDRATGTPLGESHVHNLNSDPLLEAGNYRPLLPAA